LLSSFNNLYVQRLLDLSLDLNILHEDTLVVVRSTRGTSLIVEPVGALRSTIA
jgi:hypothetical protein